MRHGLISIRFPPLPRRLPLRLPTSLPTMLMTTSLIPISMLMRAPSSLGFALPTYSRFAVIAFASVTVAGAGVAV